MTVKTFSLAAASMALSSAAFGATLDFSGDICKQTDRNPSGSCADGSYVTQSYGDIAGELDVVWDANYKGASDTMMQTAHVWTGGYAGNDVSVGYARQADATLSISFMAENGFDVILDSLSVAAWGSTLNETTIQVIDLATGGAVFDPGYFVVDTAGKIGIDLGGLRSSAGLQLLFGPDAYYNGITDIAYRSVETGAQVRSASTQLQSVAVAPVPLPAAGWMLLAGLGGLAAAGRRKRA